MNTTCLVEDVIIQNAMAWTEKPYALDPTRRGPWRMSGTTCIHADMGRIDMKRKCQNMSHWWLQETPQVLKLLMFLSVFDDCTLISILLLNCYFRNNCHPSKKVIWRSLPLSSAPRTSTKWTATVPGPKSHRAGPRLDLRAPLHFPSLHFLPWDWGHVLQWWKHSLTTWRLLTPSVSISDIKCGSVCFPCSPT